MASRIVKIQAFPPFADQFIRHHNFEAELNVEDPAKFNDFRFELVKKKTNSQTTVRFKSVSHPNRFLRHRDFRLLLEQPASGSDQLFVNDSTFILETGLAGDPDETWVSFRSVNFDDRWIRHSNFHLFVDPVNDQNARRDATFMMVDV
ncbi:AbfB domain-containing protein [Streptomyces sp. OZ13]|uniref:AbfB domain-containing protein n=1 Tax=Streptomyces sp. OZ13 TaxID=3452210 RepID=UPI003F8CC4DB